MARKHSRRASFYLAILALLVYGGLVIENRAFGVGGSDSSGYANTARDILSGRIVHPIDALDRLELPERFAPVFIPLGFVPGPKPKTTSPLYPPGFPLHVAAASLLAGWKAGPFLVSPIAAIFCVLLTYFVGRELGLSRTFAFVGAAILGGCAVYLFQAVQPMSDITAACWAVTAVLFAMRSRPGGDGWAAAAGAALGIAVLVRPANLLLALPLTLALRWRPRTIAIFIVAGLPFAAFLMTWNHAAYGGFFRTGYSGLMEHELSLAHLAPRFRHYGYWLIAQLSPLVPLGWLAVAFDRRVPGRDRAMLVSWFGAFLALYCLWGPYQTWWYTRFLLPALAPLILGFLLALRDALRLLPEAMRVPPWRPRTLAAVALLLPIGIFERRIERQFRPLRIVQGQGVFPDACRELSARAPGGKGLVVSMEFSGSLRFYTTLTPVRWDWVTPEDFAVLRGRAAARGERIFALLLPDEVDQARPRVPGAWVFLGNVQQASLWELAP